MLSLAFVGTEKIKDFVNNNKSLQLSESPKICHEKRKEYNYT